MSHLKIDPINLPGLDLKRPIIIAGPCSIETEEQTLSTARLLSKMGIKLFRAGVWKPRTHPGDFEGVGSVGFPWLKKVKKETGMYVGVEVASAYHVYEAIKHGVDMMWIGARTSANPFAVQEVANALKGVNIPVFVKNPINPDLELWIGAIERINNAGITQIAAIHRGFSTYDKTEFRNHPQWQIPIELRRRFPELPMITDPSHIGGNRSLIATISQEAMDLNFDGLIIEAHCNPDEAWSDAQQQITPEELKKVIDGLILRRPKIGDTPRATLDELRKEIDKLDNDLLDTLKERMKISEAIGVYKFENNITILQARRYDEIMKDRRERALNRGLDADFVIKIFEAIHEESINRQSAIMNKKIKDKEEK